MTTAKTFSLGYQERIDNYSLRERRLTTQSHYLANASRLLGWLLGCCVLLGFLGASSVAAWLLAGSVLLALFFGTGIAHRRVATERNRCRELHRLNRIGLARVQRDWGAIPLTEAELSDEAEQLSYDLDLFGHGSLFHLICTAQTKRGVERLRDWFLQPAAPSEVKRRQAAVRELAPQLEVRQDVNSLCRMAADGQLAREDFLKWAQGPAWQAHKPWLKWLVRALPLSILAAPILVLAGLVPQDVGMPAMMILLAASFALSVVCVGRVHDIFTTVAPSRDMRAMSYGVQAFAALGSLKGDSAQIRRIRNSAQRARRDLEKLRQIARPIELSRNPWTAIFVYLPLQVLLLWDFHILNRLEVWQRQHGPQVGDWFSALGTYEALESLASLAHDNPDWAFPDVDDEHAPEFSAEGLAHPLLPGNVRVANDVRIGPAGSLLLVTGSNMSGKSTLLRAIGTNAILAQAGAPVCARKLKMPRLWVATSMRIADSLKDGVSRFMAELLRLKTIVEAARQFTHDSGRTMLCLLDEVLQGTNSAERQIAIRGVLQHLLGLRVMGAVTTHDLALAADDALKQSCPVVHFRETLHYDGDDPRMTFDYKLRRGISPTTNALQLMQIVGLRPR